MKNNPFSIKVFVNGRLVIPDFLRYGYLGGSYKAGDQFTVQVFSEFQDILGLSIHVVKEKEKDEQIIVTLRKNLAYELDPYAPDGVTAYQLRATVFGKGEDVYTQSKQNFMELLQCFSDGSFIFWEVSVVSQYNRFFLSVQDVYRGRCFFENNIFSCPFFEDPERLWPELVEILSDYYRRHAIT